MACGRRASNGTIRIQSPCLRLSASESIRPCSLSSLIHELLCLRAEVLLQQLRDGTAEFEIHAPLTPPASNSVRFFARISSSLYVPFFFTLFEPMFLLSIQRFSMHQKMIILFLILKFKGWIITGDEESGALFSSKGDR